MPSKPPSGAQQVFGALLRRHFATTKPEPAPKPVDTGLKKKLDGFGRMVTASNKHRPKKAK